MFEVFISFRSEVPSTKTHFSNLALQTIPFTALLSRWAQWTTSNKSWLHKGLIYTVTDAPKDPPLKKLQSHKCKSRCMRTVLTYYRIWDKINIYLLFTVFQSTPGVLVLRLQNTSSILFFSPISFVLFPFHQHRGWDDNILHVWSVTLRTKSNLDYFRCKVSVSAAASPGEPRNATH